MIFERDFNNLSKEDITLLNSYFDGYNYESSGHTLIANYIWRNTHKISWQVIGEYLCIAGLGTLETEEEEYFMSMPLTRTGGYDPEALRFTVKEAMRIFGEKGKAFEMSLIPGTLIYSLQQACGDFLTLSHDREDDDYIYLKEDLVTLSGRKLHHKKNHLNYFQRNYDYVYEEATPEMVPEIMEFIYKINDEKLSELPEEWKPILVLETKAIKELLTFVGKGLLTGIIRVGGRIEAVTLGEFARTNSKETVLVHIEKASLEIRGLYQAINNEFCIKLPEETVYVNREEDMGMENLRQTKMSYKPYKLAEKYSAIVK